MSDAQIYSRGYRAYDGQRTGVGGAIRSVAWHSARSVLGIGRPGRYKVLPIAIIAFTYIPSIIYVGLSILFPMDLFGDLIPPYSDAISSVFFQVLLFAAFVIPTVLVQDRRDGMLAMYLSTPLRRSTYIFAKSIAIFGVLLFVTLGPALLQLLGFTFGNVGPDGFGNWMLTFGRIVLAGVFVAVALGTIGMAASSLTDRAVFASVGIVLLFMVSLTVAGVFSDATSNSYWFGLSLIDTIVDTVVAIFGERRPEGQPPGWFSAVCATAWTALGAFIVWLRYRKVVAIR